jgi:molybdate transport system permease protein
MVTPAFDSETLSAVFLTLKLASLTTLLLLTLVLPLAWWLSQTRSAWRVPVAAVVSLPLVLPPAVLGFYLLVALGPEGPIGRLTTFLGWGPLTFSFGGLLLGSMIYSMPFAIQPLQRAFESVGQRPLEVAATLRATPLDTFVSVVLPQSVPGVVTAAVLTFAHTVGEFGVVLMIGGNIPHQTRVVSTEIFSLVETMDYARAHWLAGGLLVFSFVVLAGLHSLQRRIDRVKF